MARKKVERLRWEKDWLVYVDDATGAYRMHRDIVAALGALLLAARKMKQTVHVQLPVDNGDLEVDEDGNYREDGKIKKWYRDNEPQPFAIYPAGDISAGCQGFTKKEVASAINGLLAQDKAAKRPARKK